MQKLERGAFMALDGMRNVRGHHKHLAGSNRHAAVGQHHVGSALHHVIQRVPKYSSSLTLSPAEKAISMKSTAPLLASAMLDTCPWRLSMSPAMGRASSVGKFRNPIRASLSKNWNVSP